MDTRKLKTWACVFLLLMSVGVFLDAEVGKVDFASVKQCWINCP